MSARDELAETKSRAEKFIAAYAEMCRIGQGIGGLAVHRPDLMPDFDAWWHASDVQQADTVLAVIAASTPRTITTAEELDALPVRAVIRGKWLAEKWATPEGEVWFVAGRNLQWATDDIANRGGLPAVVLDEGDAS